MTLSPLVSVVTPSYNAVSTIRRCCESVASQDYAPVEHLIVDGGSTDGTLEVLRESRVRYKSGPDAGIYDALSKGVRIATGNSCTSCVPMIGIRTAQCCHQSSPR